MFGEFDEDNINIKGLSLFLGENCLRQLLDQIENQLYIMDVGGKIK